jgi:protease IV
MMKRFKGHPFLLGCFTVILILVVIGFLRLSLIILEDKDFPWVEKNRVVLIEVSGVIDASEEIIDELNKYGQREWVKAIVLRIDSPGGGVVPAQEIYREVLEIKERGKPIVASMGNIGASGAYYIACAANEIFANAGTITGSIGVIMALSNIEELLNKMGLKTTVIKTGKHKDVGSPLRPLSKEDQGILQSLLNDVHNQFMEAVAQGRKLPPDKVKDLADGRIFTGQQAKSLGLIDQIGTLEEAIAHAGKLAKIPGKPKIVKPAKKKGLLSWLLGDYFSVPAHISLGLKIQYMLPY